MSVILETKQLCKFYGAGENQVKAVNQVDIQIEQGEFVAIVGKSGSGKSTLLHMLGGLDTPTKGSVTLAGKDLYRMKEDALAVFRRRKIGFVFQAFNLVSSVNVWENIVLPLGLDGRKVDEAYVNDIIATLGIENRIYNLPNQLSGGQQQRVAIARALVNRPEIIFADEPTGNLDSKTSDEVIALLKMTKKKYGQTIVMITHDDEIAQVADRILVIEDGQVVDFQMKTISRIAYSNDKRNRTRSILIHDGNLSDHDAACYHQYCGKWGNSFTEKSGGRIIWKQLWSVCFRRRIAVKRSKPPCGNRCYRHYVHRRYHKRQ